MRKVSTEATRPIQILGKGLEFPEGPVPLDDGSCLVVEIRGGRLSKVGTDGHVETIAALGGGPNGAAVHGDYCYVCNNGGFHWERDATGLVRAIGLAGPKPAGSIQRVNLRTGRFETLYDSCDGEPLSCPNDLVVDDAGGFWFTGHGSGFGSLIFKGALYYAKLDGSGIERVVFPMITPNGVGLSPDGRTLYASETETSRVWAFDLTGPGRVSKQPWPSPNGGRVLGVKPGWQKFDSMALEENGNICVASFLNSAIVVFTPEGDLLETVPVEDRFCTNLAFGGPARKQAFITLSGAGMLAVMDWPRAGLALLT